MTYKVVQWATGNVGTQSIRAFAGNPKFDLVGAYVYSPDKVGRDIGELAGVGSLGILATNDVQEILDIEADCVSYNALGDTSDPEQVVADICRLLESGKNVVSTAVSTHIHPGALNADWLQRLEQACALGSTSFHSTGVNPGFCFDVLPTMISSISDRIDRLKVLELVDMRSYTSKSVVADMIGMGMDPDVLAPMDYLEDVSWSPYYTCILLLQDAFGVAFTDLRVIREKAVTPVAIDLPWGRVEAGTVAARRIVIEGTTGSTQSLAYEMIWRVSDTIAPEWASGAAHYEITLEGDPTISSRLEIQSDNGRGTSIATSMHAVNMIPAVCAAAPGIKTRFDLPTIAGGYFSADSRTGARTRSTQLEGNPS